MICPLCGAKLEVPIRDTIREGRGLVFRCDSCDLEMLDGPSVNYDGEYRKLHGPVLGQESTPEQIFEAYKGQQAERVGLVQGLGAGWVPGKRLLEIGCSAGMFLDKLKYESWIDVDLHGIDLDRASRMYAREKTGCGIGRKLEGMGRFDVVCMFQTLEHLDDPLAYMTALRRSHVKQGGAVIVEVPSLTDPLLTLWDCPEYQRFFYHEAHKWYFSPRSLLLLMNMAGFNGRIVHSQVYGLVNALHWVNTGKPQADNRQVFKTDNPVLRSLITEKDERYKHDVAGYSHGENITFVGTA